MYLKFITFLRLIYYYRAYSVVILLRYFFSKSTFHFDLNGIPFFVRRNTSDFFVFSSIFLFNEFKLNALKEPPKVIIDLGANNGASARYFSMKFPGATIYALEPDTENFTILKKNVDGIENIKPINKAIWSKNGFVNSINPNDDAWALRFNEADRGVEAVTLESFIKEFHIDNIDLLKIDIEGAEAEVFKRADPWLYKVDNIVCELHDSINKSCSELFYKAIIKRKFVQRIMGEKVFVTFIDR